MARRKLKSAFLPRRVRNVLHEPTVPLALRVAFSSSCLSKHIRHWRAADRNNIPPHSSKHMHSVLASKGRFHKERVGPGCDGVPIAESERHICIMCRLRLGLMCSASSRIFMHKLKASLRVLNVEPLPLLVSRRWLDGDVQSSEQHFPTES